MTRKQESKGLLYYPTAAHYAEYQRVCKAYIDLLGITEYRVAFKFTSIPDSYGQVTWNQENGIALFTLSSGPMTKTSWENFDVKRTALHEVIELLMSSAYTFMWDNLPVKRRKELTKEWHRIIRRLERLVDK